MNSEKKMDFPKSIHSNCQVHIAFVNSSQRVIDIYWIDFKGNLVRYFKNLGPGNKRGIYTFATHPWVARDCATGQRMLLSGQPVFIPAEPPEDQDPSLIPEVCVHIPVFRLEEICIGFFRKHLSKSDLSKIEVNSYIRQKLCNIPEVQATEYRNTNN